jgi:hypothetical protein
MRLLQLEAAGDDGRQRVLALATVTGVDEYLAGGARGSRTAVHRGLLAFPPQLNVLRRCARPGAAGAAMTGRSPAVVRRGLLALRLVRAPSFGGMLALARPVLP